MRIAIIDNGVVLNVIVAENDFVADEGYEAVVTDTAGPGWLFDGETFTPPVTDPSE